MARGCGSSARSTRSKPAWSISSTIEDRRDGHPADEIREEQGRQRRLSGGRRWAARPGVHSLVGQQRGGHVGGAVAGALPSTASRRSAGSSASTSAGRACRIPCRSPRCRRSSNGCDDVRTVMDAAGSERAGAARVRRGRTDGHALRRDLSGADVGADPDRRLRAASSRDVDYPWGFPPISVPVSSRDARSSGERARRRDVVRAQRRARRAVPALVRALRAAVARRRACCTPIVRRRTSRATSAACCRRSGCRRSSCIASGNRLHPASGTAAISPSTSPARSTSSCPARTTSSTSATPRSMLAEIEEFLTGVRPVPGDRPRARDRALHRHRRLDRAGRGARRPRVARAAGHASRRSSGASSSGIGAARSSTPATASSRPSTDPPAPSAAPAPSATGVRPLGIEIRAGLHTGEIELDGRRRARHRRPHRRPRGRGGGPGEVLVSSTVKDLVAGSGLRFVDCGVRALKGVPDEWRLFRVETRAV